MYERHRRKERYRKREGGLSVRKGEGEAKETKLEWVTHRTKGEKQGKRNAREGIPITLHSRALLGHGITLQRAVK